MSRRCLITSLIIVFICIISSYSAYYLHEELKVLRTQSDELKIRQHALRQDTDLLMLRKQIYANAFRELDALQIGKITSAGSGIDFYSEAQVAIRKGGAQIISNSPNKAADGKMTMGMSFSGNYYDVMRSLAELRSLRNAVRVTTMTLTPNATLPGNVRLDVVLESPSY